MVYWIFSIVTFLRRDSFRHLVVERGITRLVRAVKENKSDVAIKKKLYAFLPFVRKILAQMLNRWRKSESILFWNGTQTIVYVKHCGRIWDDHTWVCRMYILLSLSEIKHRSRFGFVTTIRYILFCFHAGVWSLFFWIRFNPPSRRRHAFWSSSVEVRCAEPSLTLLLRRYGMLRNANFHNKLSSLHAFGCAFIAAALTRRSAQARGLWLGAAVHRAAGSLFTVDFTFTVKVGGHQVWLDASDLRSLCF